MESKQKSTLSRLLRFAGKYRFFIVPADGHVAEQGKPKELLKKEGLYKHMVELQSESMNWSLLASKNFSLRFQFLQ